MLGVSQKLEGKKEGQELERKVCLVQGPEVLWFTVFIWRVWGYILSLWGSLLAVLGACAVLEVAWGAPSPGGLFLQVLLAHPEPLPHHSSPFPPNLAGGQDWGVLRDSLGPVRGSGRCWVCRPP